MAEPTDFTPIRAVTKRLSVEGERGGAIVLAPDESGEETPAGEEAPAGAGEQGAGEEAPGSEAGADAGKVAEGSTEAFSFDYEGKKYGREEVEKALKGEGGIAEKEGRLQRISKRLSGDIDRFNQDRERFARDQEESREARNGKGEPAAPEYDEDDTPTYGSMKKMFDAFGQSIKKEVGKAIEDQVGTRIQRFASSQTMDSVEDTIEDFIDRSPFLKESELDRKQFVRIAMSTIFEEEQDLAGMDRRDAMRRIRTIVSDTERYLRRNMGEKKVVRAEEKKALGERSHPLPASGTPGQQTPVRVTNMEGFKSEMTNIRKRLMAGGMR